MARGDIDMVSPDPSAGHEQRGHRPMLLVGRGEFDRVTGVPIVAPITSGGGFARMAGFAVPLDAAGTRTTGVVRCAGLRALDLKARSGRRVEAVPERVMAEVLARVAPLFA
jgi:mRNA-degrading endonuclease toxin of MazEF toxin-antitoxin module